MRQYAELVLSVTESKPYPILTSTTNSPLHFVPYLLFNGQQPKKQLLLDFTSNGYRKYFFAGSLSADRLEEDKALFEMDGNFNFAVPYNFNYYQSNNYFMTPNG